MLSWLTAAVYCEETFGVHVDMAEGFFVCPECGELILSEDWPEQEQVVDVVYIFYPWQNGDIDFIPCMHGEGDPIRSTQCA